MKEHFMSLLKIKDQDKIINNLEGDFLLMIGMMPSRDPELFNKLKDKKNVVHLSVIEDSKMANIARIQSRYEAGSEEGVLAILAKEFLSHQDLDTRAETFFEALDSGYLSAESNFGEEEIEEIFHLYEQAQDPILVIGYDFYNHPKNQNLAKLISLLVKYGRFKLYAQADEIAVNDNDDVIIDDIGELHSFDGCVVYACPSIDHEEEEYLIGSEQFMRAAKITDNQEVFVITDSGEYSRRFLLDNGLKGTVALMPNANSDGSYYYKIAKIIKREN
ncbi:hypothetical protein [Sulfurospirillum sp. 1612]|uniref:hypothetical protein n=1 Tax=Sulfurospirillum sp. 1612 TaxID=3094835 RepID=UPI002F91FBB5